MITVMLMMIMIIIMILIMMVMMIIIYSTSDGRTQRIWDCSMCTEQGHALGREMITLGMISNYYSSSDNSDSDCNILLILKVNMLIMLRMIMMITMIMIVI